MRCPGVVHSKPDAVGQALAACYAPGVFAARALILSALGCCAMAPGCFETRGSAWVKGAADGDGRAAGPWVEASSAAVPRAKRDMRTRVLGAPDQQENPDTDSASPPLPAAPPRGSPLGSFRNTYYSFPSASDYSGPSSKLFDATCREIASVPQTFHDTVCVQGSGRLATGQTESFAKRDCACAQICPRTGQRICFEALDPARFPWGRGAAGRPIHPGRTLAVDTSILPLGTAVYIPAFVGLELPGGGTHDGCFRAEDRGLKVTGRQIDIFAGTEQTLRAWNKQIPTGRGLELYADPGCGAQAAAPQ